METKLEMGGSAYYHVMNVEGGIVPRCDLSLLKRCINILINCINKGYIAACHDCSEGGLAVCLSEMCIGGGVGCICDIQKIGDNIRSDMKLFSETNTRWVVEIKKEKQQEFEKIIVNEKIPYYHIGFVDDNILKISDNGICIINQKVSFLDKKWRHSIPNMMGG
jgi:phosphoribosylformylglycinamidine synthase